MISYSQSSATLTVSSGFTFENLQVVPATSFRFIDCPDLNQPGSECSNVANKWNLALFQNQPPQTFGKLLQERGAYVCSVEH